MTPQYILNASLCREPHCAHGNWKPSAKSEIENLGYATEYAEPGYSAPAKGVLFADWNYFSAKALDLLEQYGFDCHWSDEWTTCDDCGKAVRTSPDCYAWQPYFVMEHDCETVCLDCVDWAAYLESIEDDPQKAVVRECDPSQFGYALLQTGYEAGLHPGQTDDPKTILAQLHAEGKRGIVFRVPSTGQFDIRFETWQRVA